MSRNSKLREVASKLPPINKIGKDGRYLYDLHGNPIKVDHFQAMCDLKNALPQPKYPSIEKVKNPDERKKLYWDAQHKMERFLVKCDIGLYLLISSTLVVLP